MNCERVKELMADALAGSLEDKAKLEAHLRECASCREENASLQSIWSKLSLLPEQQPGSTLDGRVQDTIEAYREEMNQAEQKLLRRQRLVDGLRSLRPRHPALQFAMALVFFTLGLFIGHNSQRITGRHPALAQLRDENSSMKQLVTLSLLQQSSASERLRGMEWSARLDKPDNQVLAALLRVLDLDPNINVRLAAVGALQQFAEDPQVRKQLVNALARPQSPMVQVALINLLVREKEKESIAVLKAMLQQDEINQTVREHVEWALQELS